MVLFQFNVKGVNVRINGKNKNLKKKNFDLVLSVIANRMIFRGEDQNGFVNVNHQRFKEVYSGYKDYLDYLIHECWLERSNYIVGEKSLGYRFTEQFKEFLKIGNIILDYGVEFSKKKKLRNIQSASEQEVIDSLLFERLLSDFLHAEIDYQPWKNQLEKTKDKWDRFIDIGKWLRNNYELYKWKKGGRYFHFKTYRLYTNFVSISDYVRKGNVLLDHDKLVEFDVSNSFPLMLAVHCLKEDPALYNDPDFRSYCSSVIDGGFYNQLTNGINNIRNCGKKGNENDTSVRHLKKSEIKTLFQIYLNDRQGRNPFITQYYRNRNSKKNFTPIRIRIPFNEYMSLKYPSLHNIITRLKKESKGNAAVYYCLVQIETQFIFDVIKDLYSQFSDIRILTCHDAIYVPISFEGRVEEVWKCHMKNLIEELPYEKNDEKADDFYKELSFEAALGVEEEQQDESNAKRLFTDDQLAELDDLEDEEKDDWLNW